jgi:hypothetical protein
VTLLAPWFAVAALGAAAITAALHFIRMRQPPREAFPTARFVPEGGVVAPRVERRPRDLLLLVLRVGTVLLIGAAFARPVVRPARVPLFRITALDTASISAALVDAMRMAARERDHADSFELTVVSTFASDRFDAATDSIRAMWPGAIALNIKPPPRDSNTLAVHWPADGHAPGTVARRAVDTVGAVVAGGDVVVAPFERRWQFDSSALVGARVVARWVDGQPAAIERGCERAIAVVPPSDIALRPAYRRFSTAMHGPCGSTGPLSPDSSKLSTVRGQGPSRVPARAVAAAIDTPAPLVPWLLAAALVLVIAEMVVRRRTTAGA